MSEPEQQPDPEQRGAGRRQLLLLAVIFMLPLVAVDKLWRWSRGRLGT